MRFVISISSTFTNKIWNISCKWPHLHCSQATKTSFGRKLQRSQATVHITMYSYHSATLTQEWVGSGFGDLEVACWPLVPGFARGRSRRIFRVKKILSTPSFGGEVKPSVPCRSFTACKRSLNATCKSAFRQNYPKFIAHSSTFRRLVLSRGDTRGDTWWRKLERLTQIAQ